MLTGFPLKQGAAEWMLATTVATQRRMHLWVVHRRRLPRHNAQRPVHAVVLAAGAARRASAHAKTVSAQ